MVGMLGPVTSASKIATDFPSRRAFTASKEVTKDFPTPPFPETTAITFFTSLPALAFT
jgi:hypothetical protein